MKVIMPEDKAEAKALLINLEKARILLHRHGAVSNKYNRLIKKRLYSALRKQGIGIYQKSRI